MSPRQLRFWELVLGLDDEAVSGWIADRQGGSKLWDRRGPYSSRVRPTTRRPDASRAASARR